MQVWLWIASAAAGAVAGFFLGSGLAVPVLIAIDALIPYGPGYAAKRGNVRLLAIPLGGLIAVLVWFSVAGLPWPLEVFLRGFVAPAWLTYSAFLFETAIWALVAYDPYDNR